MASGQKQKIYEPLSYIRAKGIGISPHLRSRDRGDDGNVITKKREKTGPKSSETQWMGHLVKPTTGWVTQR